MITTPRDVQAIRAVAINVAPEVIEPFIDDAEKQDVLPVIGADLYFAIEKDRDNAIYRELLHGGTYAGCGCETQYTRGLIIAIAYLAYSRMLIFGDIQYTAYGAVLKSGVQYSTRPGEMDKIRSADAAKKMGFAILETVAGYIRANGMTAGCCTTKRVERPKYASIKKHMM